MSTLQKIKDHLASELFLRMEANFGFEVSAEDLAEVVRGRVWKSPDGSKVHVYMKEPGNLSKFYFWRKDSTTWVISGGKNDFWKDVRYHAMRLSEQLVDEYTRVRDLDILDQMACAEEKHAEVSDVMTPEKAEVARKIANGEAVSSADLEGVGFKYMSRLEGSIRYEAPFWFGGIKDMVVTLQEGRIIDYTVTENERERLNAFLSGFMAPSGGDGFIDKSFVDEMLTELPPQVVKNATFWHKAVNGKNVTKEESMDAGLIYFNTVSNEIMFLVPASIMPGLSPFAMFVIDVEGRGRFELTSSSDEDIYRRFCQLLSQAPVPPPTGGGGGSFSDTCDETVVEGMFEWVNDDVQAPPFLDFVNIDFNPPCEEERLEVVEVKRGRGRPKKDALPLLPHLKIVKGDKIIAYYPGGAIALSDVVFSPTAIIWQYLHSPFEEGEPRLPKVHPLAMEWLLAHAKQSEKVKIVTKVQVIPSFKLPGATRNFYTGRSLKAGEELKWNEERYWAMLHGQKVQITDEFWDSPNRIAVLSRFRKKWTQRNFLPNLLVMEGGRRFTPKRLEFSIMDTVSLSST